MGATDSANTGNRSLRRGWRVGFSVACAVMLLAGCGGSSQNHTSSTPSVFVTTATSWKSAEPLVPVYVTVFALAPDTGKTRWQHREEYSAFHRADNVTVSNDVAYLVGDTNTTSTDPKHPLSGDAVALRASDGSQLWRTEVGPLASAPLLDGDTLYLTAQHFSSTPTTKVAYALNATDGSIRWQTPLPTGNTPIDSLALGDGKLFIIANTACFDSCGNVDLYSVNLSDGHLAWHQTLVGSLTAQPPIIDGDHVYVQLRGFFGEDSQTNGCPFITYSLADGHELWRDAPSTCSTYLFDNGVVYTTHGSAADPSGSQALVALDGATGAQRYSTPVGPSPLLHAVSGGRIYIENASQHGTTDQPANTATLSAFDATSGALLWKTPIGTADVNCQIGASAIYVGVPPSSAPGQASIVALDLAMGSQLWHEPIGFTSQGGVGPGIIAPQGDLLFVFDEIKGTIYALRASDGAILWSFAPPPENTIQGLAVAA